MQQPNQQTRTKVLRVLQGAGKCADSLGPSRGVAEQVHHCARRVRSADLCLQAQVDRGVPVCDSQTKYFEVGRQGGGAPQRPEANRRTKQIAQLPNEVRRLQRVQGLPGGLRCQLYQGDLLEGKGQALKVSAVLQVQLLPQNVPPLLREWQADGKHVALLALQEHAAQRVLQN